MRWLDGVHFRAGCFGDDGGNSVSAGREETNRIT